MPSASSQLEGRSPAAHAAGDLRGEGGKGEGGRRPQSPSPLRAAPLPSASQARDGQGAPRPAPPRFLFTACECWQRRAPGTCSHFRPEAQSPDVILHVPFFTAQPPPADTCSIFRGTCQAERPAPQGAGGVVQEGPRAPSAGGWDGVGLAGPMRAGTGPSPRVGAEGFLFFPKESLESSWWEHHHDTPGAGSIPGQDTYKDQPMNA